MDRKNIVRAFIGISAFAAASSLALQLYRNQKRAAEVVEITQLHVFPVKSCSSLPVKELTLTRRGVLYDREWCVFRRDNQKFCTQRDFPQLKLLCATIVEDEASVQHTQFLRIAEIQDAISCKEVVGRRPLIVAIRSRAALEEDTAHHVPISIWNLAGVVVDEGHDSATWLSEFLGVDVFLGRCVFPRHPKESVKHAPHIPDAACDVYLQDFSPLHLCTEEGLQHLRNALNDNSINALRFRPNVMVRGVPFPEEERWQTFRVVGNNNAVAHSDDNNKPLLLKTVKLTSRCAMPTVNDKAERHEKFLPTAFLKKTHSVSEYGSDPKPMFGLSVFHDVDTETFTTHTLRIGDRIEVLTRTPPRVYEVGV
jgi:uncharacterized protein